MCVCVCVCVIPQNRSNKINHFSFNLHMISFQTFFCVGLYIFVFYIRNI